MAETTVTAVGFLSEFSRCCRLIRKSFLYDAHSFQLIPVALAFDKNDVVLGQHNHNTAVAHISASFVHRQTDHKEGINVWVGYLPYIAVMID